MRLALRLLRELVGLFVDDGGLALIVLGVVALTAVLAHSAPTAGVATGGFLLLGCVAALAESVLRAGRR